MPDLDFHIEGAEPQHFAATPHLLFRVRVVENVPADQPSTSIHSVILRCQVRIEPARRPYGPAEEPRLLDLFGTRERWGQTMHSMLWTHVIFSIPPFTGETCVNLPVPCNFDLSLAATRYFHAIEGGDLPLCFLFSGTIFHESADAELRVAQISWEKEAGYRLPASTWRDLIDAYYPNMTWLCLGRDVFDRFDQYRSRRGLPTPDAALDRLLSTAEEQ